jgi:hypothetical protein
VTKLALILIEKPDKTTRGVGEWEQIKISQRNSVYVPNLTQHASLLTLSRPHTYREAIDPQNQVRKPQITVEAQFNARKATSEIAAIKDRSKRLLLSHAHFIEHLMCLTKKPP